jgi:hypothetical protein
LFGTSGSPAPVSALDVLRVPDRMEVNRPQWLRSRGATAGWTARARGDGRTGESSTGLRSERPVREDRMDVGLK